MIEFLQDSLLIGPLQPNPQFLGRHVIHNKDAS